LADDLTQRPYRSSDSIARATPAKSSGAERAGDSASDPLAELARLIGQTDPFAEYGRARAPGVPEQRSTAAPDAPGYHSALPAADADLAELAATFAALARRGAAERRLALAVLRDIADYVERRPSRPR